MKNIVLASASPRRSRLLEEAGVTFEIVKPDYDENISRKSFSYKLIEDTALNKALSVSAKCGKYSVIISADTVVVYDNIILGKPKDYDDAARMLKMLSNKTHKVVTAVCFLDNETGRRYLKSETSEVSFNELTSEMIKNYILNYKPYDKAGAYGIQELDETFVKEINGNYENIIGLPSALVKDVLIKSGLL